MKHTLLLSICLCLGMTVMAQNAIKVTKISGGENPMIFLPHIGCSSEMWEQIAEYYKDKYACYLIDLAGFNGINPIDTLYTENYVKDIQAFLSLNQLHNAILVGQKYLAKSMNFLDTTYVKIFSDWKLKSDRKTLAETLCEQIGENLLPSLENNTVEMLVFTTWYFAKLILICLFLMLRMY